MKTRIICFALFLALLLGFMPLFEGETNASSEVLSQKADAFCFDNANALSISASACVLMDADSGRVLYSKNREAVLPMASTTKIMTALLTLENSSLDTKVKVKKETTNIEGSSIYLTEGEVLTVEELLYGLMLRSGNDAANTLAAECGGSIQGFVMMMNIKAGELGLKNTHFANPSGLPDENHYTTAYDLARLGSFAIKNDEFVRITSTVKTTISGGSRYLVNRNSLLKTYDGLLGVKTGYTKKAGRCLVTAAKRGGVTLVAVTLNDSDLWNNHRKMLDYGFAYLENKCIARAGEISTVLTVTGGDRQSICAKNFDDIVISLPKNAVVTFSVPSNIMLYAPVEKGRFICYGDVYANGDLVASVKLYAAESVNKIKLNLFERLFS